MRDAFGGIVNIVLVAIFLVIISGILGLVVNYTKAFRMKNTVISTIEQYEGAQGCFGNSSATGCQERIEERAKKLLDWEERLKYAAAHSVEGVGPMRGNHED